MLCYHSLAKDNWLFSIDPGVFKRQIEYLTRCFRPVSVGELKLFLKGEKDISQPSFVLTFDDGYEDIYQVREYLKQKGIKPIVFLLSDPKRAARAELETKRSFLKTSQIKALIRDGWEVGCHSSTHADFFSLDEAGIRREVNESKTALERLFKTKVSCFAYPKGRYTAQILAEVKNTYELGFCLDGGFVSQQTDNFKIPRIGVDRSHRFWEFKAILSPAVIYIKGVISRFSLRYLFI